MKITKNKINKIVNILPISKYDIAYLIDYPSPLDDVWLQTIRSTEGMINKFNRLVNLSNCWYNLHGKPMELDDANKVFLNDYLINLIMDETKTKYVKRIFRYIK